MASNSVLGAFRERLLTDATLQTEIPGGVYTNELPAAKTLPLPAVVLRYPRTDFQFLTARPDGQTAVGYEHLEKPQVECWLECLDAEDGERVIRLIVARMKGQTLPFSPGTVFMTHPLDLFLSPTTGRNADGKPQYSWCVPYQVWFAREV